MASMPKICCMVDRLGVPISTLVTSRSSSRHGVEQEGAVFWRCGNTTCKMCRNVLKFPSAVAETQILQNLLQLILLYIHVDFLSSNNPRVKKLQTFVRGKPQADGRKTLGLVIFSSQGGRTL